MRTIAALLLLACSLSAFADDARYASPNGRYGVLVHLSWENDPQPPIATAILFDTALGTPIERARFNIPPNHDKILVSDTGWFVVTFSHAEQMLDIYRPDGTPPRKVAADDVFTQSDVEAIAMRSVTPAYEVKDDQVVITLSNYGSVHLDRDGKLLDEKRDLYPPHRVWTEDTLSLPAAWPDCAERGITRVPLDELLVRATKREMPAYPVIARKARIAGLVIADVVVNANGDVVCSRLIKPLPFGIDTAVMKTIVTWKFAPGDGPVAASVGFRFGHPTFEEWRAISALR